MEIVQGYFQFKPAHSGIEIMRTYQYDQFSWAKAQIQ
jgi:hypothetical protein